jgi:hypothetical protein
MLRPSTTLFRRRIEQGANCSPFVSLVILNTVKRIYPVEPDDADGQLGLGQIKHLVVAEELPANRWSNTRRSPSASRLTSPRRIIRFAWLMVSYVAGPQVHLGSIAIDVAP